MRGLDAGPAIVPLKCGKSIHAVIKEFLERRKGFENAKTLLEMNNGLQCRVRSIHEVSNTKIVGNRQAESVAWTTDASFSVIGRRFFRTKNDCRKLVQRPALVATNYCHIVT